MTYISLYIKKNIGEKYMTKWQNFLVWCFVLSSDKFLMYLARHNSNSFLFIINFQCLVVSMSKGQLYYNKNTRKRLWLVEHKISFQVFLWNTYFCRYNSECQFLCLFFIIHVHCSSLHSGSFFHISAHL